LGNGWHALWYPQMGGYSGKAAVLIDTTPEGYRSCCEIFVWHDGEFPFSDGDVSGWDDKPKEPVNLHHCDAEQFRRFADDIDKIAESMGK